MRFSKILSLVVSAFFTFDICCLAELVTDNKTSATQELSKQVEALFASGKFAEALPIAQQWLTNCEALDGAESTNFATALSELGILHEQMGNYTAAEPLYQKALNVREKILGPEHPATANSLSSLAGLYCTMGDFARAETFYLRSLKIREKALGLTSPGYATSLNDLAGLYESTGDFVKAEPLFQRSLEIYEKLWGPEHPYTAASLNNLAGLYYNMGDYQKADECFQRSLIICERVFGPENLHTASVLNSMAALYTDTGDYAKAEQFCRRSLTIKEKALGPEHPEMATSQNNLAGIYASIGDNAKAESLYQQSLIIREKILGSEHPDTVMSVNNLAQLYDTMGEYSKAETLFNRSLKTCQKVLGLEHPDTATVMDNLAKCYRHMGDAEKAEQLYLQSLKIREKVLGVEHSDTAISLKNLALLYLGEGNYAKAEPLYRKSLGIMEKALGTEYLAMADFYQEFGFLLIGLGQRNQAIGSARKEKRAEEAGLGTILSFASERQRLEFQRTRQPYDLLATLGADNDLAGTVVHYKGVILDSLLEDGLAAQESKKPEVQLILKQVREVGRRLADLETDLPRISSREEAAKLQSNKRQLEQQIEDLQRALAWNVASLGPVRRALRVTVPEVQSELASNTMLLEFIRYNQYLGKTDFEPRYGVVLMGHPNEPVWVPLGSATNIEQNLKKYEEVMRGQERGDATALKTLYSKLIAPVVKKLPTNVTTLIISPDASLNFLSFATLVDQQEKFLVERYRIKYVASGRDLVYGRKATNTNPELAVFADPAFNKVPGTAHLTDTNTVNVAMLSMDRRDYNGISLAQLPNTDQEAEFLKANSSGWHLKPASFTGTEATEAQVKSLHSPYILHLATHGFFLPDTEPTNQTRTLQLDQKMPVVLHNPMQRSGLALAGAQLTLDAWKRGEVPDTENDGILMADEVALLDLQNTWLVTLSACDTGVGVARAGEGVLGLRRGFIQAGAQNLLMTLWPVSDKWTVDLMKGFYAKAMKTGNAPDALADVQREYLVKLKKEKNIVIAARLAGPFVMNFQGRE